MKKIFPKTYLLVRYICYYRHTDWQTTMDDCHAI